jgi:hypothetical protein
MIVLAIIGALIVAAGIALLLRARAAPNTQVTTDQIPAVLRELSQAKGDPAFAVFIFTTPDQPSDDDAVNIQFSLEGGQPGLDWVLIGPRNVKDRQRFADFAEQAGFAPKLEEMNKVKYLRVTGGDLAALCVRLITELYGQPPTAPLDLIAAGFKWPPASADGAIVK